MSRPITMFTILLCSWITYGCVLPVPTTETTEIDYVFCKAGIGGDYRIASQIEGNGSRNPVLFLFPVGGPYDNDHIICAISGDHAILDLGKGKQS